MNDVIHRAMRALRGRLSLAHFLGLGMLQSERQVDAGRGVPKQARRAPLIAAGTRQPARSQTASPESQADLWRAAPVASTGGEDDRDIDGDTPAARARARERRRCATILSSDVGQRHPQLARALAFQSAMPRAEAIRFLTGIDGGQFAHLTARESAHGASRFRRGQPS